MTGTKLCRLESLPTELLVLILSAAAHSPADLFSLICTSSTINKCFQAFKVTILTAPALHDLGPGIVDAIAICRIPRLSREPAHIQDHGPLHEEVVQDYIRQYRRFTPLSAKKPSEECDIQWIVREVTPKMAESILSLNLATQFFVDLYIATRLSYLQNRISWLTEKIDHPAPEPSDDQESETPSGGQADNSDPVALAAQRSTFQALHSAMLQPVSPANTKKNPRAILSLLERQRLSTAFLRAQLLVTLAGPSIANISLHSVRLEGQYQPPPPRLPPAEEHPELQPSSPNSQHHRDLMAFYPAWELEQISQAHYFMFVLCEHVILTETNWVLVWGGATGPWLLNIRNARRAAHRVRMARIIFECQFDLLPFRRRLMKGGAATCLHRCLWAESFDSVRRRVDPGDRGTGESVVLQTVSKPGTAGDSEGTPAKDGLTFYYDYQPIPIQPERRELGLSPHVFGLRSPLYSSPVSGEFHGAGRSRVQVEGNLDVDADEDDRIMPTFGPGPGSPENVHQVECHMALRLLLSKGEGSPNRTCMVTGSTNCDWLDASHRYAQQGDGYYGRPRPGRPEMPLGHDGEDDDKTKRSSLPAPYAWTDALGGMEWDRWGFDFVPVPPASENTLEGEDSRQDVVTRRFARWRWFGLVFWDEERVQASKAALGDYETGWLNGIWD